LDVVLIADLTRVAADRANRFSRDARQYQGSVAWAAGTVRGDVRRTVPRRLERPTEMALGQTVLPLACPAISAEIRAPP
jgi:hypothetical protein